MVAYLLRGRARFCACLTALTLLAPAAAFAQQVDEASTSAARDLGYEGIDAFQRGDFALALDKLDRAYRVLKVPTLGLWSARALAKQSKLVEASARYLEVTRLEVKGEAAVQKQAIADATQEREALLSQIPAATVQVAGASAEDVQLTIDGVTISNALIGVKRPVNPGKHHFAATLGAQKAEADATFAISETKTVTLTFGGAAAPSGDAAAQPAPATASSPAAPASDQAPLDTEDPGKRRRTIGWVTVGVGGALVVVGAVTGGIAAGKKSDLNPHCIDYKCDHKYAGEIDSYNAMRITSWVGFVGGGIVGAAGAVLLLTAPKAVASNPAGLTPYVTSNQLGVFGRF